MEFSDKISETYGRQYTDMSPFIKEILGAGVRILLYYGPSGNKNNCFYLFYYLI
jgi:hypothetical protein